MHESQYVAKLRELLEELGAGTTPEGLSRFRMPFSFLLFISQLQCLGMVTAFPLQN